MNKNQLLTCSVLSVWILASMIGLAGCVVALAPLIINAMKGSETSTATVLINEDAAKVYAEAVKAIKKRGYTEIKKNNDAKFYIEGIKKGKNATFQATFVGSNQTQVILTIENDMQAIRPAMPAAKGLMLMALLAITGTAGLKTTNWDLKISSNYRIGVASLHLVEAAAVSKCAQK